MTDLNLQKLLEIYDKLDSSKEARRIKVRVLVDYYGGAMAQMAKTYMGLEGLHGQLIKAQWGKIKPRLESSPNFTIPDKFQGLILELKNHRDNIAHDYSKIPPEDNIARIRDKAGKWYSWLERRAKKYQERKQNLTAKKALEELIEENLNSTLWFDLDSRTQELLEEDYEGLAIRAQDELKNLEELKSKGKITVDHIDLLKNSFYFSRKSEQISNELAEIGEDMARESGYGEFSK